MTTTPENWSEFNVAVAGAGAALAGLIIVAMSVNITTILQAATLPARAAASISALLLGVTASCLSLIPDHAVRLMGVEILVGAAAVLLLEGVAIRAIVAEARPPAAGRILKVLLGLVPTVAFAAGAIIMITGSFDGYYFIAGGSVVAIISAVLFSWIALVEILR